MFDGDSPTDQDNMSQIKQKRFIWLSFYLKGAVLKDN